MLEFKDLKIKYDKIILENLSGHIDAGTTTFLIGPNGSGKSSLLKTFAQTQEQTSGNIFYKEKPIYFGSHWILQNGLTGEDIFDLYDLDQSPWKDDTLLDFFEIRDLLKRKVEQLSSGEKQRLLLCAVLFHKSPVVLLDEPLTYLDWNFSLRLQHIIENMCSQGRAFLIANHDLNWILRFHNTQTWVLFNKQIYVKGSTQTVLGDTKLSEVFKIKTEMIQNQGRNFISISL